MRRILLLILIPHLLLSQKENVKWHFGQFAGLDFQNGSPQVVTTSMMNAPMGCASVADSVGTRLFYTDGSFVYDKTNAQMANGSGLLGSQDGCQNALIIRKSGSLYYLVTNRIFAGGGTPLLNYSIVDMSLASGTGSVTVKNQPISQPSDTFVTKMAATRHCNKRDVWVLTHRATNMTAGTNLFHAYLVSSASISTVPVISQTGTKQFNSSVSLNQHGFIKFSPNGRRVCATLPFRTVELYDFDNATGVLSNPIRLDSIVSAASTYSDELSESPEFSPDGTKLYVTYQNIHPVLCQFDLCAGSVAAIKASKVVLNPQPVSYLDEDILNLQLAPDGKIYVAQGTNSQSIGVIHQPNLPGTACGYSANAIWLGVMATNTNVPIWSSNGLPNFVSNAFEKKPVLPAITGSLSCGVATFTPPAISACNRVGYAPQKFKWNFGDSLSGSLNTSTLSMPQHAFSANGTYTVKLVMEYNCGADTLSLPITINGMPVLSVSGTTAACSGDRVVITASGAQSYSLNGAPFPTPSVAVTVSTGVSFTLTGSDAQGCTAKMLIPLKIAPCTGVDLKGISAVNIFPNPSDGRVMITVQAPGRAVISNLCGAEVFAADLSTGTTAVDLSGLQPGIYLLEFDGHVSKLIIQE
jgi:hypothetical protein